MSHSHLRASILKIAQEKNRSIYEFQIDKLFIKCSQEALSYSFQAGDEEEIEGLRNASYYFLETVTAKMVHSCTLEEKFDHKI